jgi:glycosyltransferase involved in cell wall biosynthesis
VHLLVFHGYLLRGTGSNVYNARLAPALARAGHTVDLLAQDAQAHELDWVDAVGTLTPGGAVAGVEVLREPVGVTVWQPDIGGLLPVYVEDRYPGFAVKTFVACSDAEVEAYVAANARAIAALAARRRPDLALINHLVMGPLAAARGLPSDVPYAVKVHGSDLEYAVALDPERFAAAAQAGIARASTLLVGSGHTARRMFELLEDPSLARRTRLGPPGVDTHAFRPREPGEAQAGVRAIAERLLAAPSRADDGGTFARDEHAVAHALLRLDLAAGPHVAYVGKLLRNKGVDLLAAAWPLVLAARPDAKLVVVGFGAFAETFDALAAALGAGDLDAVRDLCAEHDLRHLAAFLHAGGAGAAYLAAARGMAGSVTRTGRLEHHELAPLLSACTAQVVPSTFPEAFGMVAAEAAAAGVLPIVAAHSGLDEVAATLAPGLPPEARGLLRFSVGPQAVGDLADRVITWLAMDAEPRDAVRASLVDTARRLFGWEGVAAGVIAAGQGRHADLAPVALLATRQGPPAGPVDRLPSATGVLRGQPLG